MLLCFSIFFKESKYNKIQFSINRVQFMLVKQMKINLRKLTNLVSQQSNNHLKGYKRSAIVMPHIIDPGCIELIRTPLIPNRCDDIVDSVCMTSVSALENIQPDGIGELIIVLADICYPALSHTVRSNLTGVLVVVKILTHCEHLAIAGQSNEKKQGEFCGEIHISIIQADQSWNLKSIQDSLSAGSKGYCKTNSILQFMSKWFRMLKKIQQNFKQLLKALSTFLLEKIHQLN